MWFFITLLLSRLFVFTMAAPGDGSGDGGAGGGTDDKGGTAGDGGGSDDASKKPNDANGGGQQSDKGDDEDAKLQEKINKLLPDRAKQYLRTEVLAKLGFKDEKELEAAVADLKKRQDAEKTDLQKANEAKEELEKSVSQRDARIKQMVVEREVERAARGLKFRDPVDAIEFLRRELDAAEVGDDLKIKGVDVEALLKGLAKAKPYLIDSGEGDGKGKGGGTDHRTDAKTGKEKDEQGLRSRYGI